MELKYQTEVYTVNTNLLLFARQGWAVLGSRNEVQIRMTVRGILSVDDKIKFVALTFGSVSVLIISKAQM